MCFFLVLACLLFLIPPWDSFFSTSVGLLGVLAKKERYLVAWHGISTWQQGYFEFFNRRAPRGPEFFHTFAATNLKLTKLNPMHLWDDTWDIRDK